MRIPMDIGRPLLLALIVSACVPAGWSDLIDRQGPPLPVSAWDSTDIRQLALTGEPATTLPDEPVTIDPAAGARYVRLPSVSPALIFGPDGAEYTLKFPFGESNPVRFVPINAVNLSDGPANETDDSGEVLKGAVSRYSPYILLGVASLCTITILRRKYQLADGGVERKRTAKAGHNQRAGKRPARGRDSQVR
jgi:hypothetical protein